MTGAMLKRLRRAFLEAFDKKSLKILVREELDEGFDEIVGSGNLRSQVFDLLDWAERNGRLEELLNTALVARPDSRVFQEAVASFKVTATSSSKPWNVPHRKNQYFTGREDVIERLYEVLHDEHSAALGQAISGLGGIGKTQTAVQYCHRYGEEYQAVLWSRAETEGEIRQGLAEIARVLDLPEKDARERDLAARAVLRWLSENDKWLLVFDNADTPELLLPYLPNPPRGHVLLTSRAQDFDVLEMAPLRLEVMSPREALAFLKRRVRREVLSSEEKTAVQELAEELGYLPLALEQAGAYIKQHVSRFSAYLASYRRRRLELLEKGPLKDYREPVATTWSLNFEQVRSASSAAEELLKLTTCLSPDQIPDELLIKGAPALGPALSETLAEAAEDELVLDELLQPLTQYSLIDRDLEARTFSVHRMVQEVVRRSLDEKDSHDLAERIVEALDLAYPGPDFDKWPLCERLLPHWRTAALLIRRLELESKTAGSILNQAGFYLQDQALFEEAATLYERALKIREKILGNEHPNVASSLNNLALLYKAQGDFAQAAPLYERSLKIWEKVHGDDHPQVALSLNNLAMLHKDQGDYARAAPLFERSLKIREKILGDEHPDVAQSLNNLAALHHDQGNYDQAAPLLERSLKIWEKVFGDEHPDVAFSLNNLAALHHAQGDYAQATLLYERSLEIFEKAFDAKHPYVTTVRRNLVSLQKAIVKQDQADDD